MRTVRVTDPSRIEWEVRVVWAPRHRALFRRIGAWRRERRKDDGGDGSWADLFDLSGGEDGWVVVFLLAVFAVILLGLLAWWVLIPLLLLLLDALILFVLLLAGLAARVFVRRPWTVEATCADATRQIEVAGWRRALRARDGIANGLTTGGGAAWPSLALRRWD